MKSGLRPTLALLATLFSLGAVAMPGAPADPACPGMMSAADGPTLHQRLQHEAAVLEIRPSQEAAWDAYAQASEDLQSVMLPHPDAAAAMPAKPLSAAERLHRWSEHLHLMADKAQHLAEAADQLESHLGAEQKTVFDRMMAMHGRCMRHAHEPMH